uniref:Uncharacterized protein n=1 Tax=Oryza sativa subsp. japonica TaxID=39947 RepID=Q6ZKC7_ORYSJ|nr:hypothetical protein [Oryza sativa Japonica Group]
MSDDPGLRARALGSLCQAAMDYLCDDGDVQVTIDEHGTTKQEKHRPASVFPTQTGVSSITTKLT